MQSTTSNSDNVSILEKSLSVLHLLFNEMEMEYLSNKSDFILKNDYVQRNSFTSNSYFVKSYSNKIPHVITIIAKSPIKSTCSCQKFKLKKICPHLIATLATRNQLEDFVEYFLTKSNKSSTSPRVKSKTSKVTKETATDRKCNDGDKIFPVTLRLLTSDSTFELNNMINSNTGKDSNSKFSTPPKNPSCIHPFTICKLSKKITICYGCKDQLHNPLPGFNSAYDKEYCLSRFQEYYFYNKVFCICVSFIFLFDESQNMCSYNFFFWYTDIQEMDVRKRIQTLSSFILMYQRWRSFEQTGNCN